MKKKWIGIIVAAITVCMLTVGAFAASRTIYISKGQGSVTSGTISGTVISGSARNYPSSVEIMQAYVISEGRVLWGESLEIGQTKTGSSTYGNEKTVYMQLVGSYYCNGEGTVTAN